ncbi:MAG: phage tail tape measure protein [Candidatus Symbiothrix sp.]|jgi:TP901 family phage tail tape measure protein|nr:phage tail tape measure protein [Candidatus Symbiothrix sp.]
MAETKVSVPIEIVDRFGKPLKELKTGVDDATKKVSKFGDCLKKLKPIDWQAMTMSLGKVNAFFQDLSNTGARFDAKMREVSAITGATGKELSALGSQAKKLSAAFGTDAGDNLSMFQTILSRLGPQIGENAEALGLMGKYSSTLAKTMGGDVSGAVDALTTSILQFGVDLNDPMHAASEMERMMNAMAAGAKEGAAEVSDIASALKVTGGVAKIANVSIEETNAALQALAAGGKVGAEAGTALRNVLIKMSAPSRITKEASDLLSAYGVNMKKVADQSVPLADRLTELQKVGGDANVLAAMFGAANIQGAQTLISSAQYQKELTQAITGTNVAYEQADVIMGGFTERMSRFKAWIDNIKIGCFSFTSVLGVMTGAITGTLAALADFSTIYTGLSPVLKSAVEWIKATTVWTKVATAVQWLFNTSLYGCPIVWIVAGVGALVAVVAVCWNKFAGFRAVLLTVWDTMKGFGNVIKQYVIDRISTLLEGIGKLGSALSKLFKGDFKGAWSDAKSGAYAIADAGLGVSATKNALGAGAKVAGAIGGNFAKNLANESSKQAAKSSQKAVSADAFGSPAIDGSDSSGNISGDLDSYGSSAGSSAGSVKSVNINITSMIGTWNASAGYSESRRTVEDQLAESLARVLGIAETAA